MKMTKVSIASKIMTVTLFPRLVFVGWNTKRIIATAFSSTPTRLRPACSIVGRCLTTALSSGTIAPAESFLGVANNNVTCPPIIHRHCRDLTSTSLAIQTAPPAKPLPTCQLRWTCDPQQFDFQTTAELEDFTGTLLGQTRAQSAIEFAVNMKRPGYNLYVLGPTGSGKRTTVKSYLEKQSMGEPPACDWAYVYNFDKPDSPKVMDLPAGMGGELCSDMAKVVEDIQVAIPAALEEEEHRKKVQQAAKEAQEEHEKEFDALIKEVGERDLMLMRTPTGMVLAGPASRQKKSKEELEEEEPLSEEEGKAILATIEEFNPRLKALVDKYPQVKRKSAERVKELNQQAARRAIEHIFAPLEERYKYFPTVMDHLRAVEEHVVERSSDIESDDDDENVIMTMLKKKKPVAYNLYNVNLIVDNNETKATGAPVVYDDHPLHHNLIGRVEHVSQLGAFSTDFSLIKAGSLHRANGGYLVVHARDLLMQPFSWEALKRSLKTKQIKIESMAEEYSLVSTKSLQPEPIPLNVKVVLLGDRLLYYLLQRHDPDFDELFKVAADFNDEMDRSPDACQLYAKMLGTLVTLEGLRPMDPSAVASVLEYAARQVGDQEKLSTHMRSFSDLLCESDYWAGEDKADTIAAKHVLKAVDEQKYRSDRVRELVHEQIQRGTVMVDLRGSRVGQVNGLSVLSVGKATFGQPSRISATARLGRGKIVDIEREAELGGATHSKGVMILSSVLASRYSLDCPLSLSANLVFEQSYGMVDGDSASMAELCALLSVLSGVPIKQSLAITGSVNQLGEAQAIGGATQKIEGFFDVCNAQGLTGEQGVLIPSSNVKHLMLRPDILDAVMEGKFAVYSYNNVNEAMQLLSGRKAGEQCSDGRYPSGTINYFVDNQLHEFAKTLRDFGEESSSKDDEKTNK